MQKSRHCARTFQQQFGEQREQEPAEQDPAAVSIADSDDEPSAANQAQEDKSRQCFGVGVRLIGPTRPKQKPATQTVAGELSRPTSVRRGGEGA